MQFPIFFIFLSPIVRRKPAVQSSRGHPVYSHIDEVIAAFVPVRVFRRSLYPRWFSSRLRVLIRNKMRTHKAYKTSNSLSDYLLFSDLRSQCKLLTKSDYRAYVETVENSVQYNIRNFWSFVNAKRGDHSLPSSTHYEGSTASSYVAIADLFATYFGSVYNRLLGGQRP